MVFEEIFGGLCQGGKAAFSVFSLDEVLRLLLLSSGSTLAVFSMSCTGVVFMAPSMARRAMF